MYTWSKKIITNVKQCLWKIYLLIPKNPSNSQFCPQTVAGVPVKLSSEAEEVAGFYGRMLDHEYTSKDAFNKNFFHDWRKCMTSKEAELIKDLKKCNFKEIDIYYKQKSEERKAMTKEEKQVMSLVW